MGEQTTGLGPDGYDAVWDELREPPRYFDRKGQPISLRQWVTMFERGGFEARNPGVRHVADTTITGTIYDPSDVRVSTVWLGLDHSFGDGPPLVFETMVFGGPLDQEMERYSTEEEALAGHDQMVARVREAAGRLDT